ncbi:hypothetical protein CC1G_07128 [Coprinopsis cinerea okayama7|uniref:Uncharacterized protein n=1 Tax=Coprinopsis cinerea (strain Okayama-7 / 130 / ATCC MYA-4618 / FGSC 9003) TaxID=240176 RepID=A8NR58_COPC7|nr:hypothetical protein CC1G_07128 [Coprinopsis cinerea okayama7\|eukprot:XP_001835704.2 hypothetical protein CC1G_07128 [Coprinopsis cinerea okayama7\
MMFSAILSLAVLSCTQAVSVISPDSAALKHVSTHIGQNKEVSVDYYIPSSIRQEEAPVWRRQVNETNVCGANCTTHCFTPSGGAPVPSPAECNVIADALRYESENTGALFRVATATNVTMTYRSCKTFFINQDFGGLVYCRTDWAALVDWLATSCQPAQNAHGGLCVANDQRWYVQVQHVRG